MRSINMIIAAVLLFSASLVLADASPPPPPQDFATAKQAAIQRLSTELACVQAAKTPQALQQCHPRPPAGPDGRQQNAPPGPPPSSW
ncbi:hypothetical protein LG204_03315 [Methylovorus menthalis]|uniref:hypothetical protein n=1 Tax=Methylovorus menthalis TaxID=1002227 RepID=UPI001E38841F|nr:hypothetical protein [Methylovorus menthalis]MCB4810344.1 hypothetical protein [Methylovorus menthalis]